MGPVKRLSDSQLTQVLSNPQLGCITTRYRPNKLAGRSQSRMSYLWAFISRRRGLNSDMLPILSAVGTKVVASYIEIENSQRIYHNYCGWNEMLQVHTLNLKIENNIEPLICCGKIELKSLEV